MLPAKQHAKNFNSGRLVVIRRRRNPGARSRLRGPYYGERKALKSCRIHFDRPNRAPNSPLPILPIRQLMESSPLVVATVTARSVRAVRHLHGWKIARPSYLRFPTSILSSRCPPRSEPSPTTTRL